MIHSFDFSIREINPPPGLVCASGHRAPALFRREGPDSEETPTRFFHVNGRGIDGDYCEPCLFIANWTAKQMKKEG